ncbi:hypothetical protein WJX75_008691 [Coccomyxa subellipsoidea]|uniref:Fe2OG dioxygenase domain-containing protein n=1 Tax=Coccomyxa subellipsoidea TaxID=248742 RepID=A0ABR2YBS2_9CHLO
MGDSTTSILLAEALCGPKGPRHSLVTPRNNKPVIGHPIVCEAAQLATTSTTAEAASPAAVQDDGLIFGLGSEDAWDQAVVGSPVVRCFLGEDGDRWLMWYSGRSAGDPGLDAVAAAAGSIGVASSSNGIDWTRGHGGIEGARGAAKEGDVGRVLAPNEEDWWWLDTRHMTVSDVQVLGSDGTAGGGVYWMFYSGSSFEPAAAPAGLPGLEPGSEQEGMRGRAGLALSQDGKNWARMEAAHHTAAVLDAGAPGEWDEAFIGSPQVVAAGPRDMRMFYHSFNAAAQKWTVGWAASEDGFSWKRGGALFSGGDDTSAFDGAGAAACHVVRDFATKRWVMFYEGVAADNARSIGLAVSTDGLSWRRLPQPVLAAGPPGAWDCGGVGAPCAAPMADGRWRLYYHGLRPIRVFCWEKRESDQPQVLELPKEGADGSAIRKVVAACSAATFGEINPSKPTDGADVLDLSYRRALKLAADQFAVSFDLSELGVLAQVKKLMAPYAEDIEADLYKLNIHQEGDFFRPHVDTPRSEDMITVTYNLTAVKAGTPLLRGVLNPTSSALHKAIEEALETPGFMEQGGTLAFGCQHAYPHHNDEEHRKGSQFVGCGFILRYNEYNRFQYDAKYSTFGIDFERGNNDVVRRKDLIWCHRLGHHEMADIYWHYGNDYNQSYMYNYAAILIKIPPAADRL